MNIFYQKKGKGQPLFILHGLFAQSNNWYIVANKLSDFFEVWLPDFRNHGNSEHSKIHNYNALTEDIEKIILENNLKNVLLVGHSMGGKVAMQLLSKNKIKIEKAIFIDILPKKYNISDFHSKIINICNQIILDDFKNREDLFNYLKNCKLNDFEIQLILKNIKIANSKFIWKINIDSIQENISEIQKEISFYNSIPIPVLFVKCQNSDYISYDEYEKYKTIFTNSEIVTLKNTDHNLDLQNPDTIVEVILDFFKRK